MVFHWSCDLRLRSRIATLRIFIAIRLSSLITAAHNRARPIALSSSVDDLRFIALLFLFSPIYIEKKRDYLISARCGWCRLYLLIALLEAFHGGPFVLLLASLPMHAASGGSLFVATETRWNNTYPIDGCLPK